MQSDTPNTFNASATDQANQAIKQSPIIMLRRAVAWIAEHAFFATALFALIPAPRSEQKGIEMSLQRVWIASTLFAVSLAIAWFRKQSSLASALLKSVIFLTFAHALHTVLTMFAGARP